MPPCLLNITLIIGRHGLLLYSVGKDQHARARTGNMYQGSPRQRGPRMGISLSINTIYPFLFGETLCYWLACHWYRILADSDEGRRGVRALWLCVVLVVAAPYWVLLYWCMFFCGIGVMRCSWFVTCYPLPASRYFVALLSWFVCLSIWEIRYSANRILNRPTVLPFPDFLR